MKPFKLLLLPLFLFAVTACGDENANASERAAYMDNAKDRGIEREAAECMYEMLSEDIGSDFAEKFNDRDYVLSSDEQSAALKATEECNALDKKGTKENFTEARTVGIQELVDTLGVSEKDATCLIDGVVDEYGEDILGTDQTPTPEDQERIVEIAALCEIDLGGNNSTTTVSSVDG